MRERVGSILRRADQLNEALEMEAITSQEHLDEIELLDRRLDLVEQALPEEARRLLRLIFSPN